jgi:RNA polymerase sigma-70 factor (ECF subfamily)
LADPADELLRSCWWPAVATLARMFGDLEAAEDAVQDACELAIREWPATGVPASPRAWLTGVARHKALDRLRREARRAGKEAAAASCQPPGPVEDDELALIFTCCHPALDPAVRVPLTLRSVCGLATRDIASLFLVAEPTMAQRLVRAKRKIRQAGISLTVPAGDALLARLPFVLRVVYLVFTVGHRAPSGAALIRGELCDQALRLARALHDRLPAEPEVTGLLALLLLTDARRAARVSGTGSLVLLADQDRAAQVRAVTRHPCQPGRRGGDGGRTGRRTRDPGYGGRPARGVAAAAYRPGRVAAAAGAGFRRGRGIPYRARDRPA